MSIILKGVKLPEGAAGHIVGGAVDLVVNDGEALTEYRHYFYDAVEIPTPHGRLIDKDAMPKGETYGELMWEIDHAPTILEAEGDK